MEASLAERPIHLCILIPPWLSQIKYLARHYDREKEARKRKIVRDPSAVARDDMKELRPRNQTEFVVLLEMRMGGKDADAEAVSAGFTGRNRAAI